MFNFNLKLIPVLLIVLMPIVSGCSPDESLSQNVDRTLGNVVKQLLEVRNTSEDLSEHLDYIDTLKKPALFIKGSKTQGTLSKIGGVPLVSNQFKWPHWKDKPLAFLLQIYLSELPESDLSRKLPAQGFLSFYYDSEQSTWGFDPNDKGSWKVIYNKPQDEIKAAAPPTGNHVYKEKALSVSNVLVYPDTQDHRILSLNFNDDQFDEYIDLRDSVFDYDPAHIMFGYPSVVQDNSMELESQLASNGINLGNASGYNSKKAEQLKAGKTDWELLLQLQSDDKNTDMMWGDVGTLYFWIKRKDLKNQNFDNVWMILQSY